MMYLMWLWQWTVDMETEELSLETRELLQLASSQLSFRGFCRVCTAEEV